MTAQQMAILTTIAASLAARPRFYTDSEGCFFKAPPPGTTTNLVFIGRFNTYEEAKLWWESGQEYKEAH